MRCFRREWPKVFCLCLVLAALACPAGTNAAELEFKSLAPDTVGHKSLASDERYLAHSVTGPTGEEATAGQFLTASKPSPGLVSGESGGLWEGLLLNFAIQQDPQLNKLVRKQNNLRNISLANVAVLNGLSAGQSIPFLVAPNRTLFARQLLGVITTGVSIAGIGFQTWIGKKYSKETKKRVDRLTERVHRIVDRLRQGENPEVVRLEMDAIVGAQASIEFMEIWKAAHAPQLNQEEMPDLFRHSENEETQSRKNFDND